MEQNGKEINELGPMTLHTGVRPMRSRSNEILDIVKGQLSKIADENEQETYEEANDFDIDDDFDSEIRKSGYEVLDEEYVPEHYVPAEDPVALEQHQNRQAGMDQEEDKPVEQAEEPVDSAPLLTKITKLAELLK